MVYMCGKWQGQVGAGGVAAGKVCMCDTCKIGYLAGSFIGHCASVRGARSLSPSAYVHS